MKASQESKLKQARQDAQLEQDRQLVLAEQKFTQEIEAMKSLQAESVEKLRKKLTVAQNERKSLEEQVRRVSEQLAGCERQLLHEQETSVAR